MTRLIFLASALLMFTHLAAADPLGTGFVYQGDLQFNDAPANGQFDFEFEVHTELAVNAQIGSTFSVNDVTVTDGVFSVEIDFGPSPFAGDQLWLEIGVKETAGSGGFQGLAPRQKLTAAPYALHAEMVAAGAVGSAEIIDTEVQRRLSGSCSSGQFIRDVSNTGTVTCGTPSIEIPATARGRVTSSGSLIPNASRNVISSTWSPMSLNYVLDLVDSFSVSTDTAIVSIVGTNCPGGSSTRIDSVGGNLLISVRANDGSLIQCQFTFVVYDS